MTEDHELSKRGALMKEIKALVEKSFPNDLHQQGLVYNILDHNHQLKEYEHKLNNP